VLGQESYAYELAQQFDWELGDKMIFVPVGNAGNITAIITGLLKFLQAGIIESLPKVVAVQSQNANPVYRYYKMNVNERIFHPVRVKPSVAQAAMIGDPVSMPRLTRLVRQFNEKGGFFAAVEVTEKSIMESMIQANRRGLTVCTQGGECLAGLKVAVKAGLLANGDTAILNSTAHPLKFMEFQNAYFQGELGSYGIDSNPELVNLPQTLDLPGVKVPGGDSPLSPDEQKAYAEAAANAIASILQLSDK
jgi:threonine synthase